MEKDDFNVAFENTLLNDSIKNVSIDYLEFGIDTFIKSDVLREIPIIKSLYSFYKTVESLQAYYLSKKILRFLFQIQDVSIEDIAKTLKRLEEDKTYKKDLGESLILILDRFETVHKSDLLGKSFKMFLRNQLTYDEFLRIGHIIDRSFLNDLYQLPLIEKSINIGQLSKESLFSLGLLSLKPHDIKAGMTGQQFMTHLKEVDFLLNDLSRLIIRVLNEK